MLDENLPTFRLKPSSDNPLSTILYLTQNGSDPSAEYVLRRPDPALPASHNKYGIALCDPYNQDVIYGEVLVEPELSQPTLSAAEIRAQAQAGVVAAPVTATVPDSFAIQLYNPDQSVAMKMAAGTWGKSDSWEFEIPVQTFRTPTTSQLDREQQDNSLVETDLIPHIMFRWKRDGKLSKDMTCYMTGTNTAGRKSKEPDITIAMYKAAKEGAVTIYQPNLHRVELEDRKGLEIVLLLSAEVIKDLYLSPKPSMFNVQAGGPVLNKRKNSRPNNAVASAATGAVAAAAMSGALNNAPPPKTSTIPTPPPATVGASNIAPTGPKPHLKPAVAFTSTPTANIDAETRRLQEMVEREKHEREKTERAEQKRIKKMLEEEEKERRRREAEIAKETERLRKKYGVEGQDLPSDRPSLPPRPQAQAQQSPKIQPSPPTLAPQFPPPPDAPAHGPSWLGAPPPTLPPRPVSAGPYSRPSGTSPQPEQGPFHCNKLNVLWKGAAGQLQQIQHQVVSAYQLQQQQGGGPSSRPGRRRSDEERQKVQRKRSSHW